MQRPRIQHVSIPRPPDSVAQARAFYSGLLGLEEMPVPETLQDLDLVWFRLGATELHTFIETPIDSGTGRHLCIEVDDLEALRGRLEAAGHTTSSDTPIPGRPRFFCRDPFGNLIEFTTLLEQ